MIFYLYISPVSSVSSLVQFDKIKLEFLRIEDYKFFKEDSLLFFFNIPTSYMEFHYISANRD